MDVAQRIAVIVPGYERGAAMASGEMTYPFPGMDPYLEHPVLWESVHTRLIVAIANQLQPRAGSAIYHLGRGAGFRGRTATADP